MTKRVLLVDDDPVVRILLGEFLSSRGHEVASMASGEECFNHLAEQIPDILVLDYQMTNISGLEVLKTLRADPRTKDIPVILLSANNDTEKTANKQNVHADHYLLKPFELAEMAEMIEGK